MLPRLLFGKIEWNFALFRAAQFGVLSELRDFL